MRGPLSLRWCGGLVFEHRQPNHSATIAGVSTPSISIVSRFSRSISVALRAVTFCNVNRPRSRDPALTGVRNRSLFMP